MTLRERVKELANQKGVSLSKVQSDCELGSGYLSKLDKSVPNSANLEKLANYFNVSLDYLKNGEEKSEFNPAQAEFDLKISQDLKLKEMLKKYYSLSEKKQKYVADLIDLLSEEV